MYIKLKILTVISIILISKFSYANIEDLQSVNSENAINNWDDVKRLLKECHIDYFTINLLDIDNYCATQVNASNVVDFNICRYKTAVLTNSYDNDKKICLNNSENAYPDSLVIPAQLVPIITSVDKKGKITVIYMPYSSYDNASLTRDRNKQFQSCMQKLLWNNPYNWKDGKSKNKS